MNEKRNGKNVKRENVRRHIKEERNKWKLKTRLDKRMKKGRDKKMVVLEEKRKEE